MEFLKTELRGVIIIKPPVVEDHRGWFSEVFRSDLFRAQAEDVEFVQENESESMYGVVRGLHYQKAPYAQGKLVRIIEGRVLDVVVDLREGSPTFGRHITVELSKENGRQLFVPRGFAHGFAVLSERARVNYKCDNYYAPNSEAGIRFDDPVLNIDWMVPRESMIISEKDMQSPFLKDAELYSVNIVKDCTNQ